MRAVTELKKDLEFYKSLGTLVNLLKLLAAAQYQSLEKKIKAYNTYQAAINNAFTWLDVQKIHHPFVSQREKTNAVIAVTTDAGLLGGLNALVMDAALKCLEEGEHKLIIIGKRGQLYVEKHKMVFANFPGVVEKSRLEQALKLRDYIADNVLQGRIGGIRIVFPHALSFAIQRIENEQLLPFVPDAKTRPTNLQFMDIILESNMDKMIEYLIYLWLGQKIYEAFGAVLLAEQAARFMHLENCSRRIKELDQKLKFQYFRARHEIVDQNMRELFAARILNEQ
ncbi:MAG: F0F1 ATP synthase subunit gamma [Candidatus Omnitrophica bacterium]|nr:F0F1 ATP synthase subunit gamma [Candidatus Omnitrophota bacterium]